MRWLVLGSRGMFGSDMVEYLRNQNENVTGYSSNDLDLTSDFELVEDKIKDFDVIINSAAYTNVNLAEQEPERAFALNRDVPEVLAKISAIHNQKLIHISTDYVFDGSKGSAYKTSDNPNPVNVYGESKLAGEVAVANHDPKALIIRTSWLYGPKGHCFPRAILNKVRESKKLSVVDDQFGTPTSTWFLRQFCYRAIIENFAGGIHHGVPTGHTSWFGFAQEILTQTEVTLEPTKSTEGQGIAKRPMFGQLDPSSSSNQSWLDAWQDIAGEFLVK